MPNYNGTIRWGDSSSLPSVTSGTAVASTAVFGSQTRTIRVISPVGSCQVLVSEGTVSSTTVNSRGMLILPGLTPEYMRVSPGQQLYAHLQGVTTAAIWVTEGE